MSILCEFSSVGYVRQWIVFCLMYISWKEEIWPSPYTSTVGHLCIMVVDTPCTVTSGSLLPLLPNREWPVSLHCWSSSFILRLVAFSLYCWSSPYTVRLVFILLAFSLYCWSSPYTVGFLPILLAFSLQCTCIPFTLSVGLLPVLLAAPSPPPPPRILCT